MQVLRHIFICLCFLSLTGSVFCQRGIPTDTLITHMKSLVIDSADYTEAIKVAEGLWREQQDELNPEQRSAIFQALAYAKTELVEYGAADSFANLAISTLASLEDPPIAQLLDAYNRRAYLELLHGRRQEAVVTLAESYSIAMTSGDTLNPAFVRILVQRAIAQNNAFKISASRNSIYRAESIAQALQPHDSVTLADIRTTKIAIDGLTADTDDLVRRLYSVLDFCRRHPVRARNPMFRALTLLSNIQFMELADINQALNSLEEMHQLVVRYYPSNHPLMARTLSNFADAYSSIGDVENTRRYAKQASFVLEELPGRSQLKNNNLIFLAVSYMRSNEFAAARNFLKQAIRLSKQDDNLDPLVDVTGLIFLAESYLGLEQPDSAKILLDEALETYNKRTTPHDYTLSQIQEGYASYFKSLGQYEKTAEYYRSSLRYNKMHFDSTHQRVGNGYLKLGQAMYLNGDLDSAMLMINRALNILTSPNENTEVINPTNYHFQIPALHIKGAILFKKYLIEKDRQYLNQASDALDQAVEIIQKLRQYMSSQLTRQVLSEMYFDVYSLAIKTAMVRYRLQPNAENMENIFRLIQSSKAQTLLENLSKSKYKNFAGVPADKLDQEQNLLNKVNLLERLIDEDKYRAAHWKDELFKTNLAFNELISDFKQSYPAYYQLKYDHTTIPHQTIMADLESDHGLIEYFMGEDTLYVVHLTKAQATISTIPGIDTINALVRQLRAGISDYYLSSNKTNDQLISTQEAYRLAATSLYKKLLEPLEPIPKHITIIPDGILGYIPFEALITSVPTKNPENKNTDYLIQSHLITYHYSTKLWKKRSKRRAQNNRLLAFAPVFSEAEDEGIAEVRQGQLLPLIGNIEEVQSISRYFKGTILTGSEATKNTFQQLAPNFGIIHFATHAIINNESTDRSYLALAKDEDDIDDDHLYIRDLYNTKLPAELVVLSACETGLGELKKGEGIISLARGFSYAGAHAVITSLWSVSDQANVDLMQRFYENLKRGKSKDDALRLAKLSFIQDDESAFRAPFYWASTIAIGDMKPIKTTNYSMWILAACVFLFCAYLIIRHRNKNKYVPST